MSKFSDWEFMLNGNPQEFRNRASEKGTFYFNIYGGVDHWNDCPNDDYRMTTWYSEGEDDPEVIWQLGHELVSLFNGASSLFSKDYYKASIFNLLYNNAEVGYVAPSSVSALLGPPPTKFNRHQIDQEFKNGQSSCVKFPLIHLATVNKDVYFILKYLDMPESWSTYYKLMEAVEGFAKEKEIDLETVKKKRDAFTNTANNFSLSGFDSRHGFKEAVKKNNTASLTIDEGFEFVTAMAKTYIEKAHCR